MELQLLLLFMILAGIVAVEIEDLLSSVIAVGAVGLGLSLAFLILKAPDLAITQLVVEILCLIILIRATIKSALRGRSEATDEAISEEIASLPSVARNDGRNYRTAPRWFFNTVVTVIFIAVFLTIACFALRELPSFGSPIMRVAKEYISLGIEKTGATNMVAAIILDFRGYDTLGEATVLFTAVMGVLAVIRKVGRIKK